MPAMITINDASVIEGNGGTRTLAFTVTRSNNADAFTLDYSTFEGFDTPATSGIDYIPASGTLTFTAGGALTQTINVTINDDYLIEANETIRVQISNPSNPALVILADTQGIGTIINDDSNAVTINDVSITEGSVAYGGSVLTFTVTRANNVGAFTVDYSTADGSANTVTSNSDYIPVSGTLSFTAGGALTQTISVAIIGDLTAEPNETLFVNLSNISDPTSATIADAQGRGTIFDDDNSVPSLTGLAPSVTFLENTVNVIPQLLDADVTFMDPDNNFNGGSLRIAGLLAEDRVAIRNQGSAAGQIGFAAGNVSFGGVLIGTATGGVGAALTITFNAAANSAAIDALIQNLTYANVSDTPAAARTLTFEVRDEKGPALNPAAFFAPPINPTAGLVWQYRTKPALGDLDGDGDLDLVVGEFFGGLYQSVNTGTSTQPAFGPATLIGAVQSYFEPSPALGDLDGDGDLDLVVGLSTGELFKAINNGGVFGPLIQFSSLPRPAGTNSGAAANPTLGDIDGDGDLDLVVGEFDGKLYQLINNGGVFGPPTQMSALGSLGLGRHSSPALGDVDGDGDLDLLVGEYTGRLYQSLNTGTPVNPVFGPLTLIGALSNDEIYPAFGDLDGDGDLDLVVGNFNGTLNTLINASTPQIQVNVTAQAEATLANVSISDVSIAEGNAGTSVLTFTVTRSNNQGVFTLDYATANGAANPAASGSDYVAASGTLTFTAGGALTQTISVTINGDTEAEANETFFVNLSNASPASAAVITDAQGVGTIRNDDANTSPRLTGLDASVTFLENTVNAAPQLLDVDVTFTDAENNFSAGALVVSGLLAEDRLSIRNEGSGAGQIGFASGNVSFGGVVIGTATGGAGAALTVAFNAATTAAGIDALIQNLTYANVSDTPTASRTLTIDIQDTAGATVLGGTPRFTQLVGTANPANGLTTAIVSSAPSLGDLDGDGDLDLVVGDEFGMLFRSINTGTSVSPLFGALTRIGVLDVGATASTALGDLDGDGDLDLVVGEASGALFQSINIGTPASPVFGALTQIGALNVGNFSAPTLGDLDGDGDLDLVVGNSNGMLFQSINTGTSANAVFGALTRIGTLDVGSFSAPRLGDLDGDGDLDIVLGNSNGTLFQSMNAGTPAIPVFGALTQIGAHDVGNFSTPALGDLDGDGDLDLVVGEGLSGTLFTFINSSAPQIQVNVTAQAEPTLADVTINDVSIAEGNAGASVLTFTVTRSNNTGQFTLDYATANGSTNPAASGSDYVAATGTVTFAANGALTQTIGVTINGDRVMEANETFFVNLGNVSPSALAGITDAQGVGTITSDDVPTTGPDNFIGTPGDDLVDLLDGDDIFDGDGGNDTISGGGGNDNLNGGDGNDSLKLSGTGGGTLDGGAGNDTLDTGATATGPVLLTGGDGDDALILRAGSFAVGIAGGAGHDTLLIERDLAIIPEDIEDIFYTGTGNGTLVGNSFDNGITGGAGNDIIDGAGGNDTLVGRGGNDTITSGSGTALVYGGTGDDRLTITGLGGRLFGEDDNDILDSGTSTGFTELFGGEGDDTLILRAGTNGVGIAGGAGRDTLVIERDLAIIPDDIEDIVYTGTGNATLVGNGFANVITGGAGNDSLDGGAGADTLNGGAGANTASYASATTAIRAVLFEKVYNTGDALGDVYANIQNLIGSDLNDELFGDSVANILSGGNGSDLLFGMDGDDTLIGGNATIGNYNQLWGGNGSDTASYAGTSLSVYADLVATGGWQRVSGVYVLTDAYNSIENFTGGSGADVLAGDSGANIIEGGAAADQLYGRDGADTFVYRGFADSNIAGGYDTIADFVAGTDKLDLRAFATDAAHVQIISDATATKLFVEATPGTFNAATDLAISFIGANALTTADILF